MLSGPSYTSKCTSRRYFKLNFLQKHKKLLLIQHWSFPSKTTLLFLIFLAPIATVSLGIDTLRKHEAYPLKTYVGWKTQMVRKKKSTHQLWRLQTSHPRLEICGSYSSVMGHLPKMEVRDVYQVDAQQDAQGLYGEAFHKKITWTFRTRKVKETIAAIDVCFRMYNGDWS